MALSHAHIHTHSLTLSLSTTHTSISHTVALSLSFAQSSAFPISLFSLIRARTRTRAKSLFHQKVGGLSRAERPIEFFFLSTRENEPKKTFIPGNSIFVILQFFLFSSTLNKSATSSRIFKWLTSEKDPKLLPL